MHMSDALLSPAVGGTLWAASAGLVGWSARKIATEQDDRSVPLMGVTGAFVFAAQMINFAIPGTGSSGHIGGGLLLSILLGPYRAFLVLASVLTVQALLFADGGLLALGCNVFNLAFFPAFIAYPFLWRVLAGRDRQGWRAGMASVVAAVASMEMGALSVVLQTVLSGVSDLPLTTFALFMLPIHLAIGIVEGVITWGVVALVERVEPGTVDVVQPQPGRCRAFAVLAVLAVIVGGVMSWFASSDPDGLEWSVGRTAGVEELAAPQAPVYTWIASLQENIALLPDYGFTGAPEAGPVSLGTSVAGIVGALVVLAFAAALGLMVRSLSRARAAHPQ